MCRDFSCVEKVNEKVNEDLGRGTAVRQQRQRNVNYRVLISDQSTMRASPTYIEPSM